MKRGGVEEGIVALAMKRMRTAPLPVHGEAPEVKALSAAESCCAVARREGYARGCEETHASLMLLLEDEFREIERQARAAAMAEHEEDRRARSLGMTEYEEARYLRVCYVPLSPDVWPQPWHQQSSAPLL